MKITKEQKFHPIKLTIEIESEKELRCVEAILNTRRTIVNCISAELRSVVMGILETLSEKINPNGN